MKTTTKNKSMTLLELRDELTRLLEEGTDPGTYVSTEGCDCYGDVGFVDVDKQSICLRRSPGSEPRFESPPVFIW